MSDNTNIEAGSIVNGDVNTGNDFVGRDKNIIHNIIVLGQFLDFAQVEALLPQASTADTFESIAATLNDTFKEKARNDLVGPLAFAGEILRGVLHTLKPTGDLVPRDYGALIREMIPIVIDNLIGKGYWAAFAEHGYTFTSTSQSRVGNTQVVFLDLTTQLWNRYYENRERFVLVCYGLLDYDLGFTALVQYQHQPNIYEQRTDMRSVHQFNYDSVNLKQFRIIMVGLVMDLVRMASTVASDTLFWNSLINLLDPIWE